MNAPKFLEDREAAKIRHPRYDGWYWWRASETSEPCRYYLQFDGKQATPEHGGPTVPAALLGGEWGHPAPDPDELNAPAMASADGKTPPQKKTL